MSTTLLWIFVLGGLFVRRSLLRHMSSPKVDIWHRLIGSAPGLLIATFSAVGLAKQYYHPDWATPILAPLFIICFAIGLGLMTILVLPKRQAEGFLREMIEWSKKV